MARIRSVHPALWTDESFVSVSPLARLFLIGLWNEADDNGIFQWKPLTLKMRLLPGDGVDAASLLEELEGTGAIMRYETDGKPFGAVRNFRKFQRPERPKPVHPITPEIAQFVALDAKSHTCSKKNPGSVGDKASRNKERVSEDTKTGHCPVDVQAPNEQCSNTETQGPMEWCKGKDITLTSFVTPPSPPSREVVPEMLDLQVPENVVPLPSDARTVLFRQGLDVLMRMTGKPPNAARKLLGKWLKAAKDNAQLLNAILMECSSARPADAIPWIEGAIKNRTGSKLDAMARDWRLDEIDLDAAAEEDCRRLGI